MNTVLASSDAVTLVRYAYMALSMIVGALLAGSLVVRWPQLSLGERIVRFGIAGEHLTFVYGGYLALSNDLPTTISVVLFTGWLIGIVLGFVVWGVYEHLYRRAKARQP